jgi:hypothetical protein
MLEEEFTGDSHLEALPGYGRKKSADTLAIKAIVDLAPAQNTRWSVVTNCKHKLNPRG